MSTGPVRRNRLSFFVTVLCLGACSGCHDSLTAPPDLAQAVLPGAYTGDVTVYSSTQLEWIGTATDSPISEVHLTNSAGTLTLEGNVVDAIAYDVSPGDGGQMIASIVASTAQGPMLIYAYCADGALVDLETKTLRNTASQAFAGGGSCTLERKKTAVAAKFVAPNSPLTYAPPADIVSAHGPRIDIEGGVGRVSFNGADYELRAFAYYDLHDTDGYSEIFVTLRKDEVLAIASVFFENVNPAVATFYLGFRFDAPALWPSYAQVPATWTFK